MATLATFFKALGHPERIRILEIISKKPESFQSLLDKTKLKRSSLSKHLSVLVEHQIITVISTNDPVIYELHDDQIAELLATLKKMTSQKGF